MSDPRGPLAAGKGTGVFFPPSLQAALQGKAHNSSASSAKPGEGGRQARRPARRQSDGSADGGSPVASLSPGTSRSSSFTSTTSGSRPVILTRVPHATSSKPPAAAGRASFSADQHVLMPHQQCQQQHGLRPAQPLAYGRHSFDVAAGRPRYGVAQPQGTVQQQQLAPSSTWLCQAGTGLQTNSLSMPSTPDPLGTLLAAEGAGVAGSTQRAPQDQLACAPTASAAGYANTGYANAAPPALNNMQLPATGQQCSAAGLAQPQQGQQPQGLWQQMPQSAGQGNELILAQLAKLGISAPSNLMAAGFQQQQQSLQVCSGAATAGPLLTQFVGAAAMPSAGHSASCAPDMGAGRMGLLPAAGQQSAAGCGAAAGFLSVSGNAPAGFLSVPGNAATDVMLEAEIEAELDAALQRLVLMRNDVALRRACAGAVAAPATHPGVPGLEAGLPVLAAAGPAQTAPGSSMLAPNVLASQVYQPSETPIGCSSSMPNRRSVSASQLVGLPNAMLCLAPAPAAPTQALSSLGGSISSMPPSLGRAHLLLPASASATVYAHGPAGCAPVVSVEPTLADMLLTRAGVGMQAAQAALPVAAVDPASDGPFSMQELQLRAMLVGGTGATGAEQCVLGTAASLLSVVQMAQPAAGLTAAQPWQGLPQQQAQAAGWAGQPLTGM